MTKGFAVRFRVNRAEVLVVALGVVLSQDSMKDYLSDDEWFAVQRLEEALQLGLIRTRQEYGS